MGFQKQKLRCENDRLSAQCSAWFLPRSAQIDLDYGELNQHTLAGGAAAVVRCVCVCNYCVKTLQQTKHRYQFLRIN